jgi:hypothetical protein
VQHPGAGGARQSAGRASSRRRRVWAARMVWPGRPRTPVQRSWLCASAAITVQAAFTVNWPAGKCASAWSLGSRIAKLDDGVLAVLSFDDRERLGAVGCERKGRQHRRRRECPDCGLGAHSLSRAVAVISAAAVRRPQGTMLECVSPTRADARNRQTKQVSQEPRLGLLRLIACGHRALGDQHARLHGDETRPVLGRSESGWKDSSPRPSDGKR